MTATYPRTDHPRLALVAVGKLSREIRLERERAHAKHGAKGNSRENAAWDDREWLPILVEEVGEVARELTYDAPTGALERDDMQRLRKELVQVAAMATAWIAAIDEATA